MPVVVAGLLMNEGKMLIAQRREGDSFAYKWELPGGKLEADETFEAGLAREMKEEFSIDVSVGEFVAANTHDYRYVHVEILVYRVHIVRGTLTVNAHERVAWVYPDECDAYDFLEADKPILAMIKERFGKEHTK